MEVIFISITDILASEFAKTIRPNNRSSNETIVYGTIIKDSETTSVRIDGSETRTPISTTTDVEDRERVTVLIKDHQAIVTGNTSSPSARNGTVQAIDARVVSAEEILAFNNNQIQSLSVEYLKVTETLIANTAKIEKLEGNFISYKEAVFDELEATNARIDKITSTEITTEYLEANYATIENLKATNARIDKIASAEITTEYLEANYATIENLKSTNATVKSLTAITAKIDTLIFGSASGDVIQTQFSNSVIAQLGDAQIKSAMIQDVAASKITAGTIYTDDVTIQSKNGQMILSDNTIQISDSTRVRVQIGKDASGDYSINVWDKSGNLMFSQGGITDKAIKSAIIRNDMVSENANISAGKLNISSLFTEINKSSETIKATKIYLDEEKQTLEVSFKSMTTTVDGLKQTQMSQGTQIEVLSEKISSKIWEQDITTAVKGINVGGTNLLRDTKTLAVKNGFVKYSTTITVETDTNGYAIATIPADGAWDTINFYFPNDVAELVGKEVTLSFDAKSDGLTLTFDQWLLLAAVFNKNNIRLKNKRIAYMNDGAKFNTSDYIDGEWVRCYITFVLPTIEEMTTNVEGEISTYVIQLYSNLNNTTHPLQIRKVKCEFGNKATDWAPAPGDVETDITSLSTKYSILEQDVDSFKTTVSATYSTKTELQTTKSTLEQSLNSFKTTVSATYSTKTELQTTKSTLEQTLNSFKTTVSATYTTLDQFNSMEIGGRNILRGTYIKSLSNANSWEAGGFKAASGGNGVASVVPIDDSPVKSIDYAVQITGNTSGNRDITQTGIPYIPGEQYTFSIWVKGTGTLLFRSWNSTTGAQDASIYKRAVSFDKWTRVIATFLSGSTEGSKTIQFGITGSCDSMMFVAPKIEKGNKATDWSPAPEDTETAIITVQTIATQTANKFNWLVKNGTSATDFTLTDRMAELTAEIISLNGNVKVNGDMIVKGAITPDKIAIGDFTNLSALNPDTYVPNDPDNYEEYTVVTDDDGSKWFKFGSDTDMAYFHIYLNMLPGSTTFKKGDKYLFRGLMYASAVTSVRICLRVWYSDGGSPTYTNMASVYNDSIPTEQTYIQIPFTINALPTPGRPIQRYGLFLETRNTKLGIIYTRELAVHQMAGNVLIADGAITADKVNVTDLFAQDIVASGSITSPLLKSSDYSYTGGGSGGTEYSKAGMIVDLRNKIIRAPKFCLRADGTICAENGVFSGTITAKSGSITGTLSFGADGSITHTSGNYKVTLRGVRSNTAHGVFYITDNSSGSATYPFMVSGDGSFIATKATITGKITANEGRIGPIIIQNGQGLYFNPTSNTATGFGLWATTAHANIAFHAGANNNNIGGAPFRIYHNGDVVARNIDVQGGKIGYWSVDANGVLAGTSGEMRMELYPKGKNYNVSPSTSDTFFLVIYESGGAVPIGGITRSGWKNVWR